MQKSIQITNILLPLLALLVSCGGSGTFNGKNNKNPNSKAQVKNSDDNKGTDNNVVAKDAKDPKETAAQEKVMTPPAELVV
jgi:hypothetical protein